LGSEVARTEASTSSGVSKSEHCEDFEFEESDE
jgi:hypothetical protein